MKKILAGTFHAVPGQEKAWVAQLQNAMPTLKRLYSSIHISATPSTGTTRVMGDKSLVSYFNELDIECRILAADLGDNHRSCLAMALSGISANISNRVRIHYCDFDRILVWSNYYPGELERILTISEQYEVVFPYRRDLWNGVMVDGLPRRRSAWNSHPIPQKATEIVVDYGVNNIIGRLFTEDTHRKRYTDPLGTSQITSVWLTDEVIQRSSYIGFPQAEWLGIILSALHKRNDFSLSTMHCEEVDGLTFETLEIYRYLSVDPFEDVFNSMFYRMETSKDEAMKRIAIGQSMLKSFVDALKNAGFSDIGEDITLPLIENLEHLKIKLESLENGSRVKEILEDHYIAFLNES